METIKRTESIEKQDLASILAEHAGNYLFEQALNWIANSDDLVCILGRYVHFNCVFGSGVANLAGEVAARRDLFRDLNDEIEPLADRSVEVAADIFFAAVDEFGDRGTFHRSTHRSLAQATLKAIKLFFGYEQGAFNKIINPNKPTFAAICKVGNNYGINQAMDEKKIFRAIGFHMGSEILADEEFGVLNRYLRARYADLVEYLQATRIKINNIEHPCYLWIQAHTTVEADHFCAAKAGADLALRYYAGQQGHSRIKHWIMEGFKEFATIQAEFMSYLIEEQLN
jgi:hypothetical protein